MTKAFPLMIWLLKMCCYIQSPTLQSFYLHPSAKFYTAFLFVCLNGRPPRKENGYPFIGKFALHLAGVDGNAFFQAGSYGNKINIPT